MKMILAMLFGILSLHSEAQADVNAGEVKKKGRVSFTVLFDSTQALKHGFSLNGYIVNIPDSKAGKFHGKQIRIKGRVQVIKKLDENDEVLRQGYNNDVLYIDKPVVKIIKGR